MKGIELIEKLRSSKHWDNISAAMAGTADLSVKARDFIMAASTEPGQADLSATLESLSTTAPVHVEAVVPMMEEAQAYVDLATKSYASELMRGINSRYGNQSGLIDAHQLATEENDQS